MPCIVSSNSMRRIISSWLSAGRFHSSGYLMHPSQSSTSLESPQSLQEQLTIKLVLIHNYKPHCNATTKPSFAAVVFRATHSARTESSGYEQKSRSLRVMYVFHICRESSGGSESIVATRSLLSHIGTHQGCRAMCSCLNCLARVASSCFTACFPVGMPLSGDSSATMSCPLEQYSCRVQTRYGTQTKNKDSIRTISRA